MKLVICAVRDAAADCFNRPFFVQSAGVARRSFGDEVMRNADENPMFHHPEHFELFELGTYDDANASFEILKDARSLCRAVDFRPVGKVELKAVN